MGDSIILSVQKKQGEMRNKKNGSLIVNRCLKTLRSLLNGIWFARAMSSRFIQMKCVSVCVHVCVCVHVRAHEMSVCIGLCDHLWLFSVFGISS